jgi:hypothetical protein
VAQEDQDFPVLNRLLVDQTQQDMETLEEIRLQMVVVAAAVLALLVAMLLLHLQLELV